MDEDGTMHTPGAPPPYAPPPWAGAPPPGQHPAPFGPPPTVAPTGYPQPPSYGAAPYALPPAPVPVQYAPPPPGYYPMAYQPLAPKVPGLAVAGFACSMAGLFFGVFSLILPILGIVFSAVGLAQAKRSMAPTGLATAGLWIGIGSICLYIAVFVIFLTSVRAG